MSPEVKWWFLHGLMPTLVVLSFVGTIAYMFAAAVVHGYLKEHYHDALPQRVDVFMSDYEAAGGFIAGTWYAYRTGAYKRIESRFWRSFFIGTQMLGGISLLSVVALCASFLFWPR